MMFIIFIIITYTRDKNCQLTSWRWKVLLNNLFFLWGGGGGGEKVLITTRKPPPPPPPPRRCVFPPENLSLFQAEIREFSLLKESTESNSISSANGCNLYPFSHQNVFFPKKKQQKQKKTLWHPQKGSPPPRLRGPQSFLNTVN